MLKQGNCVKSITLATGKGSLQANSGESFLVRRIYCLPSSADKFLVLRVDRKTVGAYRLKGKAGNNLSFLKSGFIKNNLMEFLESKGINVAIPVAEGQEFTIDRTAELGDVTIVYDCYDAGDIRSDMPNGSDAKEYTFIQYMNNSAVITVAGDTTLDESQSPAEFPDFPCGAVVPARHKIDMLGLLGTPVNNGSNVADLARTLFVKLIKDREVLFDEDYYGIPFRGSYRSGAPNEYRTEFSLIGGCVHAYDTMEMPAPGDPLLFDPPLSFVAGEELLVKVTCGIGASKTFAADVIDLAAILRVTVE